MDTGKIFLGIAFIAFSVTMAINPANAAGYDYSCPVGSGNQFDDRCQTAAALSQEPNDILPYESPSLHRIHPVKLP